MDKSFRVTFWGVRGGYPVPGPSTCAVGGNTTCLEVRVGSHLVILDAGTGIIGLGEHLLAERQATGRPIIATLLFTHTHHDHTQGLPFFAPSFLGDTVLYIFGPKMFQQDLEDVLNRAMLPPVSPIGLEVLHCQRTVRNVSERDMIILTQRSRPPRVVNVHQEGDDVAPWAVRIRILHSYAHPKGGVLIYKIIYQGRSLVFATDTEGYAGGNQRLIKFARGADLLIHDAEYVPEEYFGAGIIRQGWGHSTWEMAVETAQAAGVRQLVLFHHNARHDDDFLLEMEQAAQARFPNTVLAREGMTIEL